MIIYVDIDDTITTTPPGKYIDAVPNVININKVNRLYDIGHYIVYWTARGVGTGIDYTELTTSQLQEWGCKYNELRLDKPVYNLFIDDKAITNLDNIL